MKAEQVAAVVSEGGPPSGTTIAEWVAKSRQESSHNEKARDFVSGTHIGLWQIAISHLGIDVGNLPAREMGARILEDPRRNFVEAKKLYAQSGWAPWRATGGKPTPNANDIAAASNPDSSGIPGPDEGVGGLGSEGPNNPINIVTDPIEAVANAIDRVGDMIGDGAEWIANPSNMIRILQVGGGITLAIIASYVILKPTLPSAIS